MAGGAGAGAGLGGLGHGLFAVVPASAVTRAWLVAVACVLAAAAELPAVPVPLPTIRRQVDEDWLARYRGWVYGAGFGFQLGLGAATIVTTAGVYLAWALALLSGSVVSGAAVGLAFGMTRALPVLATARVRHPEQLRRLHRGLQRGGQAAARVTKTALALTAAAAVIVATAGAAGAAGIGGSAWPG